MQLHRWLIAVSLACGACARVPEKAPASHDASTATLASASASPPTVGPPSACRPSLGGPSGPLPAGWVFAGGDDAWMKFARELVVAEEGTPKGQVVTPPLWWSSTALSPDGSHAAFMHHSANTGSNRLVLAALTPSPRVLRRFEGDDASRSAAFAKASVVITTVLEGSTHIAVLELPSLTEKAARSVTPFGSLVVSADGRTIALARGSAIVILDGASLAEVRKLPLDEPAKATRLSDDGATLLVELSERVQLFDVASGKVVARAEGDGRRRVALAPDGAHFVSATDDAIVVHARSGKVVKKIAPLPRAEGVAFAGSGDVLVSRDGSTERLALVGAKQTTVPGSFGRRDHVGTREDGTLVVLAEDGPVRIVSATSVVEPLPWDHEARAAAFDPEGRSFATRSGRGLSWYDADSGVRLARLLRDGDRDIVFIEGRKLWIDAPEGVAVVELEAGRLTGRFHARSGERGPIVLPGLPLDQAKLEGCQSPVVGGYGDVAATCEGFLLVRRDHCSDATPVRLPLRAGTRLEGVRGPWVALTRRTAQDHDGVELLAPDGSVAFALEEKGDLGWGALSPSGRWAVVHRLGRAADSSLLVDVKAKATRDLPFGATVLGFLDDTRAVYRLLGDELRIVRLE